MPLVVNYWVDLQSVYGLHCYGNIMRTRNVSEYMLVLDLYLVVTVIMLNNLWYIGRHRDESLSFYNSA